ncbi:hypothetical protein Dip510_000538 [Elusimicrobium posterum]|uniref:hypothetical protein n=1 Tax=Elusimicrobium posterum TaxID=3116653 RepID=UPI003C750DB2
MKKILTIITLSAFALPAFAGDIAYVAKQDNKTLYLDITEMSSPIVVGTAFKVIESEETLKNRKGESLGTVYNYGPQAVVTQVEPKYAVAVLSSDYKTKADQKLQITKEVAVTPVTVSAPQAVIAPVVVAPPSEQQSAAKKLLKTAALEEKISSATMVKIDGKDIIIAAAPKNTVKTFELNGYALKETGQFQIAPYKKILTLSAADIKGTGKPQVYVILHEEKAQKVITSVLEFSEGKLAESATLRWAAKVASTPQGAVLYGQEIYKHNEVKKTPVTQIVYEKGKFKAVKSGARVNSNATSFSFSYYSADGGKTKDSIFSTDYGRVKMLFAKGKDTEVTENDFATTPTRFDIAGSFERVLLPVPFFIDSNGVPTFAAAANDPKLGIVADSFGMYKNGTLHFLQWNGTVFKSASQTPVEGVVYDLSAVTYNGVLGVMLTQVFDSGNTVFEIYY